MLIGNTGYARSSIPLTAAIGVLIMGRDAFPLPLACVYPRWGSVSGSAYLPARLPAYSDRYGGYYACARLHLYHIAGNPGNPQPTPCRTGLPGQVYYLFLPGTALAGVASICSRRQSFPSADLWILQSPGTGDIAPLPSPMV